MDPLQSRVTSAIGDLYDLEAEIGRGGMAVVYRARDMRLRRLVAVKVLPPDLGFRPDVKSRFLREAQTSAQLNHPNIVPIFSVDERDGLVYFVMGLVEGESLAARLARENRPPLDDVRRILHDVSDALEYAHAHGVVHRDVKPDNILIERESGRTLVTDFGIARAAEAESRLTVTGIAVGTPTYMSPEQALGEREVDGRSDIYSLGVVGYQMLAGETPFRATNTPSMLMKHLSETPRPLRNIRADLTDELIVAIERSLAKKPEERWSTAGEFRDTLKGIRPSSAARPSMPAAIARNGESARGSVITPNGSGRAQPPVYVPMRPPIPAPPPSAPMHVLPPMSSPYPAERPHRDSREEVHRQWREASRQWKEQVRIAHDEAREHIQTHRQQLYRRNPEPVEPEFDALRLEQRVRAFRRHLWRSTGTVGFLAAINIATSMRRPWFLFPAAGLGLTVAYRAGSLWADGVSIPELFGDVRPEVPAGVPAVVYERVRAFRRRLALAGVWSGATAVSFAIGAGFHADPMIPIVVISMAATVGNFVAATLNVSGLRKVGVRVRDALTAGWRTHFKLPPGMDPGPVSAGRSSVAPQRSSAALQPERLAAEASRLASPDVLAGTYGGTIRRALADREAIVEIVAKLGKTDRELLPDVAPTVAALIDRIVSLGTAMHRLDGDATPEALQRLEARIATVEHEPANAPDRERKLSLLQRQRQTLQDLVRRRDTLLSQMESAALVLQNLKLDLVKLRSSGVQASIDDVTSATQEARALSRDIANVLDAAAEIRSI